MSKTRTRLSPNEIILHNDYAEMLLYDGESIRKGSTLISLCDVDRVKQHKWCQLKSGYIMCHLGLHKNIYLHRFIVNCSNGMVVDHINHDKADNRRENLRICTKQQNEFNHTPSVVNKSGIVGVCWATSQHKWIAQLKLNQKNIILGRFENKEDAIKVRKEAEKKYFGKFAYKEENIV